MILLSKDSEIFKSLEIVAIFKKLLFPEFAR